jgi:hypothetical protein
MGIEETQESWTRVDLYCDGLGAGATSCVAYGNPDDIDAAMPMVTDCRLTLFAAAAATND